MAIIGGGAAGMITAYLLDPAHQVTVFERQAILGGNIRTLGRNVPCDALPAGLFLDAGVIEFSPEHFPTLHRLFALLGVETRPVPATTAHITASGRHYFSAGKLAASDLPPLPRAAALLRLLSLAPALLRFRWRAQRAAEEALMRCSVGEFLGRGRSPLHEWLRLLLVYGYSIPRDQIDAMPAALAVPTLLRFTGETTWTSVVGGIYRYIERIVEALRGEVRTEAIIDGIRRGEDGAWVQRRGADPERFDAVVLAAPPDQVLRLLRDPTSAEERRFSAWRGNDAEALIHTDSGMYRRRGIADYSEFDVFADPPGYNAYLNRLSGLPPSHPVDYHFAYNLGAEIDPSAILHVQRHRTPLYTVASLASRPEIIAANGENHTYYAGAWLGEGLHEGAVVSALEVARRLGGRALL